MHILTWHMLFESLSRPSVSTSVPDGDSNKNGLCNQGYSLVFQDKVIST